MGYQTVGDQCSAYILGWGRMAHVSAGKYLVESSLVKRYGTNPRLTRLTSNQSLRRSLTCRIPHWHTIMMRVIVVGLDEAMLKAAWHPSLWGPGRCPTHLLLCRFVALPFRSYYNPCRFYFCCRMRWFSRDSLIEIPTREDLAPERQPWRWGDTFLRYACEVK